MATARDTIVRKTMQGWAADRVASGKPWPSELAGEELQSDSHRDGDEKGQGKRAKYQQEDMRKRLSLKSAWPEGSGKVGP